jgi:magnesium transporter
MPNTQVILIPEIRDLLSRNRAGELRDIIAELHVADIAEIINGLDRKEEKITFFNEIDERRAVEVFEDLRISDQQIILRLLPQTEQVKILNSMSPDERRTFFDGLSEEELDHYSRFLDDAEKEATDRLAAYEPDTAGGIMTTEFVTLPEDLSVAQALNRIRLNASDAEQIYSLYVVDSSGMLIGNVSLKDIILTDPDRRIVEIMNTNVISVHPESDQEAVAHMFGKYDVNVLPVVTRSGVLIGIITVDDIIDVIGEEDTEDMYRFGGIGETESTYFQTSAMKWAKKRIVWLSLLVLTGFVSGFILERYEEALSTVVMLAFFIPVLMDSGGNAGTQAATVIVRGLATGEVFSKFIIERDSRFAVKPI